MDYARVYSPTFNQTSMTDLHERAQNGPIFTLPKSFTLNSDITPERRRKLLISYLPDWLITLVLAAIFFSLDHVDGYQRVFSLEDTSLRHPHAVHERVPNIALYFICGVAPLVLQWVVNVFTVRSFWDAHNATLGLFLSLAITGSVTQFVKITVGRPRPDFIDRCQPIPGSVDPTYGLSVARLVCTQADKGMIRDGFRSFFSGHSSLSFAGLGHLSYYLAGKLHLFDTRGHAGKAWLALSPFAAAALVAISRTMDYRHHWQDVLVGSIVGTVFSFFCYRQYYPPLESPLSHRPYSPRIPRDVPRRDRSDPEQGEHVPMTQRRPVHSSHSSVSDHDTGYPYTPSGSNGGGARDPKSGTYSSSATGPTDSLSMRYDQPDLLTPRAPPRMASPTEVEDELVEGTVKRPDPEGLR